MPAVDRLSALPDEVVTHILSLLPTKLSVSTSILARRWRYMWAHVPILDLESCSHRAETRFPDIVTKVLSLHKVQNLITFRIHLDDESDCSDYELDETDCSDCENDEEVGCSDYEAAKWIATVIARNVRKLDICLGRRPVLPKCLFTCKTLVDLKLISCGYIPKSGFIYLPALKKLHLNSVRYEADESLPNLLSGCPVLEQLIIWRSVEDLSRYHISSPTLTLLALETNEEVFKDGDDEDDIFRVKDEHFTVELDTPALEYLELDDSILSKNVSAGPLTSLIRAHMSFIYNEPEPLMSFIYNIDVPPYRCFALEFVDKLYNVRSLRLSTSLFEVLDSALSVFTMKFHNLTTLELNGDWCFIPKFLELADNLQRLAIDAEHKHLKCWREPKQVPTCLVSHLVSVKIGFECTEPEFDTVRYILRKAKVLKVMEIYYRRYSEIAGKKPDAIMRISSFERRPRHVSLSFFEIVWWLDCPGFRH